MQYSEGQMGRVFVLRLEHGDRVPDVIEQFATDRGIQAAMAIMVGGADDASRFVVGPEDGSRLPVTPMLMALAGVHEVAAVGTIFPDAEGRPVLHMHAAFGRGPRAQAGCVRAGVLTWHVLEVVLVEINGVQAARLPDENTGFTLLQCSPGGQ